ncbi:MAG: hypothetical protein V4479_00515, partial [Actinomycetota bacterium]
FWLGRTLVGLESGERFSGVLLDDGSTLPGEVLVEAIGSECNTEWLAGTALQAADGVLADAALRAVDIDRNTRDDVYVVGDIARFPNLMFDRVPRRVEADRRIRAWLTEFGMTPAARAKITKVKGNETPDDPAERRLAA